MRSVVLAWLLVASVLAGDARAGDFEVEGAILPGEHTRLDTPGGPVHVWVPEGYRAETATLVVYLHGYHVEVDDAWWAHGLPEQFGASSINALFVAPAVPSGPYQKLAWGSLAEVLSAIDGQLSVALPKGRLVLVGHSGAYRTIEQWLGPAGDQAPEQLATLVLLDAGYGTRMTYLKWVRRSTDHRLITVSSDTQWWCQQLHRQLPSTRNVDGMPARPEALQTQRIVHIRTSLDHWQVVTRALPTTLRMLRAERIAPPGSGATAMLAR